MMAADDITPEKVREWLEDWAWPPSRPLDLQHIARRLADAYLVAVERAEAAEELLDRLVREARITPVALRNEALRFLGREPK